MSYTPTEWETGDVVTAEKLNKLEQGVANSGGSGLIVGTTFSDNVLTFDKTYKQIHDALLDGTSVVVQMPNTNTDWEGFWYPNELIGISRVFVAENSMYCVVLGGGDLSGYTFGSSTETGTLELDLGNI